MKKSRRLSRLTFFAFLIFSGSLLAAKEPSMAELSKKIEALEAKLTGLTAELASTQAKLREVSKFVMTGRLELTAKLAGNGRFSLVGKGLNLEELGGNDLNADEFVQKLKSITEQYPEPKMSIAGHNKLTEKQQSEIGVLCLRAGISGVHALP
jgi:hypothetical protein